MGLDQCQVVLRPLLSYQFRPLVSSAATVEQLPIVFFVSPLKVSSRGSSIIVLPVTLLPGPHFIVWLPSLQLSSKSSFYSLLGGPPKNQSPRPMGTVGNKDVVGAAVSGRTQEYDPNQRQSVVCLLEEPYLLLLLQFSPSLDILSPAFLSNLRQALGWSCMQLGLDLCTGNDSSRLGPLWLQIARVATPG